MNALPPGRIPTVLTASLVGLRGALSDGISRVFMLPAVGTLLLTAVTAPLAASDAARVAWVIVWAVGTLAIGTAAGVGRGSRGIGRWGIAMAGFAAAGAVIGLTAAVVSLATGGTSDPLVLAVAPPLVAFLVAAGAMLPATLGMLGVARILDRMTARRRAETLGGGQVPTQGGARSGATLVTRRTDPPRSTTTASTLLAAPVLVAGSAIVAASVVPAEGPPVGPVAVLALGGALAGAAVATTARSAAALLGALLVPAPIALVLGFLGVGLSDTVENAAQVLEGLGVALVIWEASIALGWSVARAIAER